MRYPEMQKEFEAVKVFITETTKLTQEQLYYLSLGRLLLQKDVYDQEYANIKDTASSNVDLVSEVVTDIKAHVPARVYITDPTTGKAVPANGLDFSMETGTYIATVAAETTWLLADGSQLSLRPETGTRPANPLVYGHGNTLSLRGAPRFWQDDCRELHL